jgi:uncharacterized repeat protein (TIGR01451 family)
MMSKHPRTRTVAIAAAIATALPLAVVTGHGVAHATADTGGCQSVVQNALVNAGFEAPAINAKSYKIMPETSLTGWHTTASDHMVEVWSTGFNGVSSTQGNQFAELNANMVGMLYQDVATIPGTTISWRIAHRGRSGVDKMDVRVGAPTGTLLSQSGGIGYSDGTAAWVYHGGTYTVPAGQTVTRFGFDSISSVGGVSYGNFLDVTEFGVTTLLACPDQQATKTGAAVTGDVFANDLSASTMTVTAFTQPAHGKVTVAPAGFYSYVPASGYSGTDAFTYTVVNAAGEKATTNVTVAVANAVLPKFDDEDRSAAIAKSEKNDDGKNDDGKNDDGKNGDGKNDDGNESDNKRDHVRVIEGEAGKAGSVLEYTVTKTNHGDDTALNTVVRASLPACVNFIPGSLRVVSGTATAAGRLSDNAGDDLGYWTGGVVNVNVGRGATAKAGGAMAPGDSVTVAFRARLNESRHEACTTTSTIDYVGEKTNRAITEAGRTVSPPTAAPVATAATPAVATTTAATPTTAEREEDLRTFKIHDAGFGDGATCPATLNEDRLAAEDVVAETFTKATPLFTSAFGSKGAPGWEQLSGHWLVEDKVYTQADTCGFDYSALLTTHAVEHFSYAATFHADKANQGGIVFNQSSIATRSGASVVDLSKEGTVLRWGSYDARGYYRQQGVIDIPTVAPGQSVTIAVEVHGSKATVSFNGSTVTTMSNINAKGYVGLVTNQSKIGYESVALIGLPVA